MNSSKTGFCMAQTVYLSLGLTVFTPFFGKCNIAVSLVCAFLTAFTWITVISLISKADRITCKRGFLYRTSCIISSCFTVLSILLFMTQVIELTCFIVGKGVSKQYYLLLSLGLLFAAMYLCTGSENGILRFCMTGVIPLAVSAVFLTLPFFTSNGISTAFNNLQATTSDSIFCGIKGGIILSGDISLFNLCFRDVAKQYKNIFSINYISLTVAFLYTSLCIMCVYLLFGANLTQSMTYPYFAQTKAFSLFDTTEAVSAAAIFAFIAKSAVYVRCAAKVMKNAFFLQKRITAKKLSYIILLSVPLIYLPFLFFSSAEQYGKYQFLIYPVTAVLALAFAFLSIFEKKQDL